MFARDLVKKRKEKKINLVWNELSARTLPEYSGADQVLFSQSEKQKIFSGINCKCKKIDWKKKIQCSIYKITGTEKLCKKG